MAQSLRTSLKVTACLDVHANYVHCVRTRMDQESAIVSYRHSSSLLH